MRIGLFALLSLLAGLVVSRLEVRTAITEFLPRDQHSALLEVARELADAPQSRVLVLTVEAPAPKHVEAARALAERLRASGSFAWVRGGLSDTDQSAFYDLFFPARFGLLELPPGDGPVPDAYLDARVASLRDRLAGPLGAVERRLAPRDPLGGFAALLERQARARGTVRLEGDQLVTDDGRYAVLFAETRASAFDTQAQRAVAAAVEAGSARAAEVAPGAKVEWSGLARYALDGERSVRGDIERISTLSVLGIFVLYLLVFRSLREPLLVLLPIAFGCLLATALCQLAFGFVHGLALAFGSAIIGVAEDYSTHYLTHRLLTPASEDNHALMRRLWPGMLLGAITTVAGIATLFGSGFPGLSQMALFGTVGVLGALLCTREVLPSLSRRAPGRAPVGLDGLGARFVRSLSGSRGRLVLYAAPSLLLMGVGLPRVRFVDEVSALRTPAPLLDALGVRMQARLGRGAPGRVVVATGADDAEALRRAEAARVKLEAAREAGVIDAYRSVTELLPSEATQRARIARLTADPTLATRLDAALTRNGFVPTAFAPFVEELAAGPAPLRAEAVRASKLADLIAPFRAELAHGVAYLTPVEGERGDVAKVVAGLEGVHYLDQPALFSAAYGRFRARTIWLSAAGLVLVLGILLARYRSAQVALVGMLPAVLGAGAALGLEALRAVPITMLHVVGVMMVLSMGVDYGIYALESRHSDDDRATTFGGMLLAALTTVLSFGLLGMSDNPALAAIGATVGFGMVFTVIASPLVLALARNK
ncbi:MAG: MMPL family transporter [Polyangiales bacterium]